MSEPPKTMGGKALVFNQKLAQSYSALVAADRTSWFGRIFGRDSPR